MYIRDLAGSVTRPVKAEKVSKVALKAGEKKQVSFTIDEALLAFYGIDMQKKAEPGDFTVWVGLNSADEANQSSFLSAVKLIHINMKLLSKIYLFRSILGCFRRFRHRSIHAGEYVL